MGRWNISARPDMEAVRQNLARSALERFAKNLVQWGEESHVSDETENSGSIAIKAN